MVLIQYSNGSTDVINPNPNTIAPNTVAPKTEAVPNYVRPTENSKPIEKGNPAEKKEFNKDRAKSTVLPMSEFGIVQITRQRIRQSIIYSMSEPCPLCAGTGSDG